MLIQFETKSQRVKGLCFHPTRPWLLSSLKTGQIQLWEYNKHVLLDVFEEHEGPVRCVDFHPKQNIFVSAGDDQKIKVWDYQQRRCLFTLVGHNDYIRTCFFHREHPWIVSASDDNVIRIWNWQSRTCLTVLTGHNHYVMCAQFHPTEDLIISGSLDATARIWDVRGLAKKGSAGGGPPTKKGRGGPPPDLFATAGSLVRCIMEGHDRGVNWAAFHHSQPLAVTASDDRTVKLWRYSEHKAVEVETFRGHFNNVSCAIFHPRLDLIISDSEDKHIRVWDLQGHTCVKIHRREKDRFWVLAGHKQFSTFAAGHEGGLMTFKLERERPPISIYQKDVYYVKNRILRVFDMEQSKDKALMQLKKPMNVVFDSVIDIFYNPAEHALLCTSSLEGGSYELYKIPASPDANGQPLDARRAMGISAVWVARNRFAVLDKTKAIMVKDMNNEVTKTFNPPHLSADKLFYCGTGQLLIRSEEHLNLYDLQQKKSIAELDAVAIKRCLWSSDSSYLAVQQKHGIIIADRNLKHLCQVGETTTVKSATWDIKTNVLIYTTSTHIKYLLLNGDSGIIRTLDIPIYLTAIKNSQVYCLDREARALVMDIDPSEYLFKHALVNHNYDQVLYMIQTSKLIGQSIIRYLQLKGYPEIALHFVTDVKARFNLALECGKLDVALEAAKQLDDEHCWNLLGSKAMDLGNHQMVELTYQRTKNLQKLCFLYLITGNIEKLEKLTKVAAWNNDPSYQYQTALCTGDITNRLNLLDQAGLTQLAYLTAASHGMSKVVDQMINQDLIPEEIKEQGNNLPSIVKSKLLLPPTPCFKTYSTGSWPHLQINKSMFEAMAPKKDASKGPVVGLKLESNIEYKEEIGDAWGGDDDLDLDLDEDVTKKPKGLGGIGDDVDLDLDVGDNGGAGEGDEYRGWDMDDELDLPDGLEGIPSDFLGKDIGGFNLPSLGPSYGQLWIEANRSNMIPCEYIASGDFETAMKTLNSCLAIRNFEPLKDNFGFIFSTVQTSIIGIPSLPTLCNPIHLNPEMNRKNGRPLIPNMLQKCLDMVQAGYAMTTKGNFSGAIELFKRVLWTIPLLKVNTKQELVEAQQIITIASEYIVGLSMEIERQGLPKEGDQKAVIRGAELAAYFSHCNLQPAHAVLTLRVASTIMFKLQNFKIASLFARRMLELGPPPAQAQTARKIVAACQKNMNDATNVNYDEHNPFVICANSYTPIYKGNAASTCPYCQSNYLPQNDGQICNVCDLSVIGAKASGLFISPHQRG